jgi:hypothetical protein
MALAGRGCCIPHTLEEPVKVVFIQKQDMVETSLSNRAYPLYSIGLYMGIYKIKPTYLDICKWTWRDSNPRLLQCDGSAWEESRSALDKIIDDKQTNLIPGCLFFQCIRKTSP